MDQKDKRHIDFDKVAKYLSGELSDKEHELYKVEIEQDEVLRNEIELYKSVLDKTNLAKPFNPDEAWNKLHSTIQQSKLGPTKSQNPWVLRIAASLALLIGLSWWLLTPSASGDMISYTATDIENINLQDGSVITANSGSELTYEKNLKGTERRVQLNGEAYFDVEPDPTKPFVVKTDIGSVTVLGTEFSVYSSAKEQFKVVVNEGKVAVVTEQGEEVTVVAGESAYLDNNYKLIKVKGVTDLFWLSKTLKFRDTKLALVFDILEKNYKVEIDVENEAILNCIYSGTFKNAPIDTVLHVLNIDKDQLSIQKNGNKYEIKGRCD